MDTTLNEPMPVEYHADAVVLLVDERPVFGAIVEAQLAPDPRKLYTWPVYGVLARARHECPFAVIVVAPDPATARWAAHPIDLGGNVFRIQVIGPEGIPIMKDVERATREPELAVLSALAHGDGDPDTAVAIAQAAGAAIASFPEKQQLLYLALIQSALSGAARKAFEMLVGEKRKNFLERQYDRHYERGVAEGEAKGKAEGEAKGKIESILRILVVRKLTVSDDQRQRITSCTQLEMLDRWLTSALSVASVDELFAQP